VLEGHTSVAALAVAAQIALHTHHVSATTLPLVSSRRLWSLDIERALHEGSFLSASLIGFNPGPEDAHLQALREAAERPMRKCSIRDLVPLFVLGADRDLQAACCAALERFPDVLELEYREEAADPALVRSRQREGEIWREWGRAENWMAHPVAGREGVVAVQLESPQAMSADVQAAARNDAQMERELTLAASHQWPAACLRGLHQRALLPGASRGVAVERLPSRRIRHDRGGRFRAVDDRGCRRVR